MDDKRLDAKILVELTLGHEHDEMVTEVVGRGDRVMRCLSVLIHKLAKNAGVPVTLFVAELLRMPVEKASLTVDLRAMGHHVRDRGMDDENGGETDGGT